MEIILNVVELSAKYDKSEEEKEKNGLDGIEVTILADDILNFQRK